jgi:hypothetical protein
MTTSGVITGLMTARDIVGEALALIGASAMDETPSASAASQALRQLNWMLKSWQADGCNLWRDQDVTTTWPAAASEALLDINVLDVFSVRWVESATNERELTRWERADYARLPNKAAAGSPTIYSPVRDRDAVLLRLWPVPTAGGTLKYEIARVVEDVTDLDQTVDVPQEWTEAVFTNLAVRLLPLYREPTQSDALLKARADELYARMRDADRPASYFLG